MKQAAHLELLVALCWGGLTGGALGPHAPAALKGWQGGDRIVLILQAPAIRHHSLVRYVQGRTVQLAGLQQ